MGRLFWKFFTIIWLTLMAFIVSAIGLATVLQTTPFSEELAIQQRTLALSMAEGLLRRNDEVAARHLARVASSVPDGVPLRIAIIAAPPADCAESGGSDYRKVRVGPRCFLIQVNVPASGVLERNWPKALPWVVASLASMFAAFLLARYLVRPIANLREGLSALAQGRFDVRIGGDIDGRQDELTALVHDFDASAARLQELRDTQQRLFHNVSHELRSPLSRMQAALGVMRQNPDKVQVMSERMDREIGRIDGLIEEILTLARLSARSGEPFEIQEVDVIDLLGGILEDAAFEGQARGIRVEADIPPSFVARVNGELIYRALENVIRNALKYTTDSSCVTVRGAIVDRTLQLTVSDQGPGIDPKERDKVFRPFSRSDDARAGEGYGLGLAITRHALERHGGSVTAEAADGGGLRMLLQIPARLN